MRIEVRVKEVYGKTTIYPHCAKAKTFARMLGQKTLTEKDVKYIKDLGFIVAAIVEGIGEL